MIIFNNILILIDNIVPSFDLILSDYFTIFLNLIFFSLTEYEKRFERYSGRRSIFFLCSSDFDDIVLPILA